MHTTLSVSHHSASRGRGSRVTFIYTATFLLLGLTSTLAQEVKADTASADESIMKLETFSVTGSNFLRLHCKDQSAKHFANRS